MRLVGVVEHYEADHVGGQLAHVYVVVQHQVLEPALELGAALLVVLHDAADLLEPFGVELVDGRTCWGTCGCSCGCCRAGVVAGAYHETSGLLEQDDLVGVHHLLQLLEVRLVHGHVRYQRAHDLRPRAVQALVPDGRREAHEVREPVVRGGLLQLLHHQPEQLLALVQLHQVHLVQQHEDLGVGAVLPQLSKRPREDLDVLHHLLGLHVEYVDQHLHHLEYVVLLLAEVVLHEHVLAPAVPQVQRHVPQKPQVRVLHIHRDTQPAGVERTVVAEDDGPHARLPGPGTAHQQQLLPIPAVIHCPSVLLSFCPSVLLSYELCAMKLCAMCSCVLLLIL